MLMLTGSPSGSVTPATVTVMSLWFGGQSMAEVAAAALQLGGRFAGTVVVVVGGSVVELVVVLVVVVVELVVVVGGAVVVVDVLANVVVVTAVAETGIRAVLPFMASMATMLLLRTGSPAGSGAEAPQNAGDGS